MPRVPNATRFEDFLGSIHALVGEEIRDMLTDVDPRQRREGVQLALKFLKDNNITAQLEASAPMANMVNSLPSAAELES